MKIDISYSSIVDAIQGDHGKAKKLILQLVRAKTRADEEAAELEEDLRRAKGRSSACMVGMERVLQHINLQFPVVLDTRTRIIEITKEGVSIKEKTL